MSVNVWINPYWIRSQDYVYNCLYIYIYHFILFYNVLYLYKNVNDQKNNWLKLFFWPNDMGNTWVGGEHCKCQNGKTQCKSFRVWAPKAAAKVFFFFHPWCFLGVPTHLPSCQAKECQKWAFRIISHRFAFAHAKMTHWKLWVLLFFFPLPKEECDILRNDLDLDQLPSICGAWINFLWFRSVYSA